MNTCKSFAAALTSRKNSKCSETRGFLIVRWLRQGANFLEVLLVFVASTNLLQGQGSAFTYQGKLATNGVAVSGLYDLQFELFDASTGGNQVGGPIDKTAVNVSEGAFTVTLDFGSAAFSGGANRWLQIGVRANGEGSFEALTPRQAVTPTPYAIVAGSITGIVPESSLAGVYTGAITLSNAANLFTGTFQGNGSGLSLLDAGQLASGIVPDGRLSSNIARTNQVWLVSGNSGTGPASNQFLGTIDNQPVEFKVNGRRALRLEPSPFGTVNVIGGTSNNVVHPGAAGATIGGGDENIIAGASFPGFATIAGGEQNAIRTNGMGSFIGGGSYNVIQSNSSQAVIVGGYSNIIGAGAGSSTIGGGYHNTAVRGNSTIGGGSENNITGNDSTIAGGYANTVSGAYSTIGGGGFGTASGLFATVPGGSGNTAAGDYSFAAGWVAKAMHEGSFVWSDFSSGSHFFSTVTNQFSVRAYGGVRFVTGGAGLTVDGQRLATPLGTLDDTNHSNIVNVVNGSPANYISNVYGATIAGGGGSNYLGYYVPNAVFADFGSVGGGEHNTAGGVGATVGGGRANTAGGDTATIAGGVFNFASGTNSTVAGGYGNFASGNYSVVGGGGANSVSGLYSSVGGGYGNYANGSHATVPGGNFNTAGGTGSFAAGQRAQAQHSGTFVWGDDSAGNTASTAPNQFLLRASGGVGVGTTSPGAALEVRTTNVNGNVVRFGFYTGGAGNLIAGPSYVGIATDDLVTRLCIRQGGGNIGIATLTPAYTLEVNGTAGKLGGGTWSASSDARIKKNIETLQGALDKITQIRGVSYEWVNPVEHGNQTGRQTGFIAQEVERVFPNWIAPIQASGQDSTLTSDGQIKSLTLPFEFDALTVEAIRELRAEKDAAIEKVNQTLTREVRRLDSENAELKRELQQLKELVGRINPR